MASAKDNPERHTHIILLLIVATGLIDMDNRKATLTAIHCERHQHKRIQPHPHRTHKHTQTDK